MLLKKADDFWVGIGIIFGLAGSTARYFILIGFGYVGIIISSLVCIFRPKYYPAILISLALIIVGGIGDARFWSQHNAQLCADLRADPTCVESATGFQCTDFREEGGFSVGSGICREKLSPDQLKIQREEKISGLQKDDPTMSLLLFADQDNLQKALTAYSNIVDKIVNNSVPSANNYADQLVAIYNCLEKELGTGYRGELMATQTLVQKKLSEDQLKRYYAYLASIGRNVNPSTITAGLPAGSKNLTCEDIAH